MGIKLLFFSGHPSYAQVFSGVPWKPNQRLLYDWKPTIKKHPLQIWLVVSTHLKNISQNGNLPQIGVKIKNIWNHGSTVSSTWMWRKFQSVQQFMSQADSSIAINHYNFPHFHNRLGPKSLRKKIYYHLYLSNSRNDLLKEPGNSAGDLFGMVSSRDPLERLSDLQLRDQKVTLNHLEEVIQHTKIHGKYLKMNQVNDFLQWNPGCLIREFL